MLHFPSISKKRSAVNLNILNGFSDGAVMVAGDVCIPKSWFPFVFAKDVDAVS